MTLPKGLDIAGNAFVGRSGKSSLELKKVRNTIYILWPSYMYAIICSACILFGPGLMLLMHLSRRQEPTPSWWCVEICAMILSFIFGYYLHELTYRPNVKIWQYAIQLRHGDHVIFTIPKQHITRFMASEYGAGSHILSVKHAHGDTINLLITHDKAEFEQIKKAAESLIKIQ